MKRQEVMALLKDVPFKFRTSQGTYVTIRKVLEAREEVIKFLDLKNQVSIIGYEDILPPITVITKDNAPKVDDSEFWEGDKK